MSIIDPIKAWVFGIALKKAVASAAKLVVSYCMAKGVSVVSVIAGIPIDTTDVMVMTAAINSGLKMLFNWMKVKWPKLSWLP